MQRIPNEDGGGMGYWRFDCITVLLIILGLSLFILGLISALYYEPFFVILYIGIGSFLLVIAAVLAWQSKDG